MHGKYCQVLRGVPAPRLPRQHAGGLDRAAGGGVRGARHHLQRTPQHPQVPRDRAGQYHDTRCRYLFYSVVLSSAVQNVDKHLLSEMEYLISDWIVLLFHGVLFSKSQLNFLFDVRCVSILNSNQRCPNCPPHSQYWDQNTTAAPCLGTQSNTVH